MSDQAAPAPKRGTTAFVHIPHPWLRERSRRGPVKTEDHAVGFNGRLALQITKLVGSMWCAYIFCILALIGLPAALSPGGEGVIAWIAQTFLQLVLLSVIMVGQQLQSATADARAESTYSDAEAILHECLQLQEHLQQQDSILERLIAEAGGAPSRGSSPA